MLFNERNLSNLFWKNTIASNDEFSLKEFLKMKYLRILSFNLILILSFQSFVEGLVSGKRDGDSDDGDIVMVSSIWSDRLFKLSNGDQVTFFYHRQLKLSPKYTEWARGANCPLPFLKQHQNSLRIRAFASNFCFLPPLLFVNFQQHSY